MIDISEQHEHGQCELYYFANNTWQKLQPYIIVATILLQDGTCTTETQIAAVTSDMPRLERV